MKNLSIETPVGPVDARLVDADESIAVLVLAHGAGAGIDHPWMVAMQDALVSSGFTTIAFNYAYTTEGRKAPDRLPKLLTVHEAVVAWVAAERGRPIVAGKSMGGRVGGHIAADGKAKVQGVVYLGYPLVAMGKTEPRDTSHLDAVEVPQLWVSGTRDRMGPWDMISALAGRVPSGTAVPVETGDHSFKPLKASGLTLDEVIPQVAASTREWWLNQVPGTS